MTRKKKRQRGGATVECPHCHSPTAVLRTSRNGENNVHRTRYCEDCDMTWRTREQITDDAVSGKHWWLPPCSP